MTKVVTLNNTTGQLEEVDLPDPIALSIPAYTQAPSLLRIPLISSAYILVYNQAGTGLQIGVIT